MARWNVPTAICAEWHSNEMEKSEVRRESSFCAIFIGDFHFLIEAIGVQCRENRSITKRVNTLVHPQHVIKVRNGNGTLFVILYAKMECFVFRGANPMGAAILFALVR